MKPTERTEILRHCSFLAGVGGEILAALGNECHLETLPEGTMVVTKGEAGSRMYFIGSGSVRVHDGATTLTHLDAGEVFGEMAVLDADVRSASVTTEEETTLLSLEREDLWRVISSSPQALKTIIAAILRRERNIVQDVTTRTRQLLAYEKELEIGRRIQGDFLPQSLPSLDGWEISSAFEAAREVAGDFYDAFELKPGRRIAIVIGDVCDKGVGAALFMTLFRSLIRASCQYGSLQAGGDGPETTGEVPAAELLLHSIGLTNRYIATTHSRSSMFASVFFGVLDPESGELAYVNGGHESPMIFRAGGGIDLLEVTGGVLGLFPFARFTVAHGRLGPGDLLLSYTDGVNEAKNGAGEQFTEKRIREAAGHDPGSPAEVLGNVLSGIRAFRGDAPPSDDVTMLAIRRIGDGLAVATPGKP